MRFLSWNIQLGGGKRCEQIIRSIIVHDPDIVCLYEMRSNHKEIPTSLREQGFIYQGWLSDLGSNINTTGIFSKTPFQSIPSPTSIHSVKYWRWQEIFLTELDIHLLAVHIPFDNEKEEKLFWQEILEIIKTNQKERLLLLGDLNTGMPFVDETRTLKGFTAGDYFMDLSKTNMIDVWRFSKHQAETEYTWYSFKAGQPLNGFRIDHAFASPALNAEIDNCFYSHAERENKISDHSLLICDITIS